MLPYLEDQGQELIGRHAHEKKVADIPSIRHGLGQLNQEEEEEGGKDNEDNDEGDKQGGHNSGWCVCVCCPVAVVCVARVEAGWIIERSEERRGGRRWLRRMACVSYNKSGAAFQGGRGRKRRMLCHVRKGARG